MKPIDNMNINDMSYRFKEPQDLERLKNNPLESYKKELLDSVSLTNHGQLGMKVVFHSVSTQVSSSFNEVKAPTPEEIKETNDSLFDFEKVAENVLSFISGRINFAKEQGSSDEELSEMFSQARSGVTLGFQQALGELEELAILDDELSTGIEKSRVLIFDGIDDLEEKYFPKEALNSAVIPESNMATSRKDELKGQPLNFSSELYAQSSKSSDISITTRDGDKVTISFSDIQEASQSQRYSNFGDQGTSYESASSSYREMSFSYSIEGDIDEDEQKAISALIKDVNTLQKEFFNGDVNKAFEYAQTLGFDDEQISEFSFDLYKTQTTMVSQAYSEVANFAEDSPAKTDKQLRPLLDFVAQLQDLQTIADKVLSKQEDNFTKLFDKVFTAQFNNNEEMMKHQNKLNDLVEKFLTV
jgi:hypothetical protein